MSKQRTVAVLTEIKETSEQTSFRSIHRFCEELAQYGKERGLFFYVTSPSLYLQRTGYQWIDGEWAKRDVPPADVVYNRLHSRQSEHSPLFAELLIRLAEEGGAMFNRRFLHKWEVYRLFERHEYLHPHLPKTALWSSEDVLESFLGAFPSVFLKPIHGSQGRGIFCLERSDGGIRLRHSTSASAAIYSSTDTLASALRRRTKLPMIVQQGLELRTLDGRPVDFRLLCHRVRNNHWRVTSAVARVAPPDQFVANLARGGELMAINAVLRKWHTASDAFHQKQLLKEIAIEAATVLAFEAEGLYGEFGIDLAIDVHGQPWIIEVNTKPSKQTETTAASQTVRPSAKAIIDYCLTLIEEKE
ncbi:alpha-L-glutamate ligase [Geobacillus subterraneus]|uniref:Alpha-L-glutamate ligase n=2 Tax=Geobacillus TaxID=129337 RepID=A0ABM6ADP9_9BACL|nr:MULTISPECIES: YheC/YheD family protein [Geobacillus]AMX84472.1 alpha-L-glutamate ligase [Geobacillus subterraneus]KZS24285.1 alpha-L-glutamate ligase [Geobacillus subterraneus]OXB87513.1 alpha-L-glutamate ligase [Geobacillus uzenensis]QIZ66768.1 YheC/YheD family protein [Geobacillus subterraneus]WPZ18991.1 YheC/YheD family protein [Geobacillus subterraneus]